MRVSASRTGVHSKISGSVVRVSGVSNWGHHVPSRLQIHERTPTRLDVRQISKLKFKLKFKLKPPERFRCISQGRGEAGTPESSTIDFVIDILDPGRSQGVGGGGKLTVVGARF